MATTELGLCPLKSACSGPKKTPGGKTVWSLSTQVLRSLVSRAAAGEGESRGTLVHNENSPNPNHRSTVKASTSWCASVSQVSAQRSASLEEGSACNLGGGSA